MDGWSVPDEERRKKFALDADKPGFLAAFAGRFQAEPSPLFAPFNLRRAETLAALGATSLDFHARTRLVVGLGLPNPIETGFLLDRLTGCPCIPGSTVKGLLRAAARLVAAGDLEEAGEEAQSFWSGENLTRIFGPEIEAGIDPRRGEVIFYDAFPLSWPRLTVEVLTPHQTKYYEDKGPPADWNKPVPVPFLAVEKGTGYRFWLGPGRRGRERWGTDLTQLSALLGLALDGLGIGGKKAAGFGVFGEEKPSQAASVPAPRPRPLDTARASGSSQPVPASSAEAKEWKDVELRWHKGSPAAFHGQEVATFAPEALKDDLLKVLKTLKKKKIRVLGTVRVKKFLGNELRIVAVLSWKEAGK